MDETGTVVALCTYVQITFDHIISNFCMNSPGNCTQLAGFVSKGDTYVPYYDLVVYSLTAHVRD